jgi:hypothetical protein
MEMDCISLKGKTAYERTSVEFGKLGKEASARDELKQYDEREGRDAYIARAISFQFSRF